MKWLRRNLKKRFRYAFRHPGYTVKALFHDVMGIDERFLASLVNSTPGAIRGFLNEPSENACDAALEKFQTKAACRLPSRQ